MCPISMERSPHRPHQVKPKEWKRMLESLYAPAQQYYRHPVWQHLMQNLQLLSPHKEVDRQVWYLRELVGTRWKLGMCPRSRCNVNIIPTSDLHMLNSRKINKLHNKDYKCKHPGKECFNTQTLTQMWMWLCKLALKFNKTAMIGRVIYVLINSEEKAE